MGEVAHDPGRVEQVAALIRRMTPKERAQLVELVPELRHEASLPTGQRDLIDYFSSKLEALPSAPLMRDEDPFIGGLSVREFFALPEKEQARLWDEAHARAEAELGSRERPVRPDALPA
jgi:hypothetical protein